MALMDLEGVAHVVRIPAVTAPGAKFEAHVPSEGSWGDPANEFATSEVAVGSSLGALLLANWAGERVGDFLDILESWLPRIQEGAFLASVMEQTAYCARALGRVGMDFSSLARGPFRDAVLRILDIGLHAALDHWKEALRIHRWNTPIASAAALAALVPPPAAPPLATEDGAPPPSARASRQTGLTPPVELLQHPIVAVFLNHILAALNELRPCAPYELRHAVCKRVQSTLLAGVNHLAEVLATSNGMGLGPPAAPASTPATPAPVPAPKPPPAAVGPLESDAARNHFTSLCRCVGEHMVPHVAACLDQLVPPWVPPPDISAGRQNDDALAAELVEAVREALRPLQGLPGSSPVVQKPLADEPDVDALRQEMSVPHQDRGATE